MDLQPTPDRRPSVPAPRGEAPGPAGPGGSGAAAEVVLGLSLRDVLHVIRRHAGVVVGITVVTVGLVAWWVLTERTEYQAGAVIELTDIREGLTGMTGTAVASRTSSDPLATQLQILQSRSVVGAVVDREGLRLRETGDEPLLSALTAVRVSPEAPPTTLRLWFEDEHVAAVAAGDTAAVYYGDPVEVAGIRFTVPERPDAGAATLEVLPRDETIDVVARDVEARLRPQTSIIDVTYRSHDRERARRVVNALVDQFVEHSVRTAQEESRRRRLFLAEQLAQVDSVLAEAQAALTSFRSREGVYSSQQQGAAQQTGLLDLQMRREELAADRQMYESLLGALTRSPESDRSRRIRTLVSAPGIAENPVISQLYGQLIRYENARDSLVTGDWGAASTDPAVERLERLLDSTRFQLVDAVRSHIDAVDARLTALDRLETRVAEDLRELPARQAEEARLAQQVETVRRTAEQLREEHQEARIAEAVQTGNVDIIDRASRAQPVDAREPLKLALGLALGLMLGLSVALVMDTLNTAVRTKDDVERVLGLTPLGVVPRLRVDGKALKRALPARERGNGSGDPSASRELVALHDQRSSGAEAYRTLRTNLLFSKLGEELKTVVVTSAVAEEGKSTVASNLATTFAQQGVRVLLVDADLRKARLHRMFGQRREPGLTEWVLGEGGTHKAVRKTEVDGLFVLPAGTLPPNPSELLGSDAMRRLMKTLREVFELVIFDSPPLLAAGDAAVLGARADGVVLVVRAGETDQGAASEAVRQLEMVRARILGVVLNDPDGTVGKHGGYYQYDYYGD